MAPEPPGGVSVAGVCQAWFGQTVGRPAQHGQAE